MFKSKSASDFPALKEYSEQMSSAQYMFKLSLYFQLAEKELTFDFFETSARTGENVFAAFRKLAYHVTDICSPALVRAVFSSSLNCVRT